MPDFSSQPFHGLGADRVSIYQARFMHHLNDRGMVTRATAKVWAFLGDGEMDEPESMGGDLEWRRERNSTAS